ncbi:MAG: hypothetical protein ACRDP8_22290, partial [Actinopolymorphaceae bacterium]
MTAVTGAAPRSDTESSETDTSDHSTSGHGTGAYDGVAPDRAWQEEVRRLAAERDAVLLAHNYQVPAIQD